MSGDILQRLREADWRDKPESTMSSQLIMPMLMALGGITWQAEARREAGGL